MVSNHTEHGLVTSVGLKRARSIDLPSGLHRQSKKMCLSTRHCRPLRWRPRAKKASMMKKAIEIKKGRTRLHTPLKRCYQAQFCGECGKSYGDKRVWTLDEGAISSVGLKNLFCPHCGERALPFLPAFTECVCQNLLTSGAWCTDCG